MRKSTVVIIVYCFTIVAVSAQLFDDLLLTGNYIDQEYYSDRFTYGPGSTLSGPARRIATPIVEEDTEPPVHFPPSRQAVQLNRKATVVPHQRTPSIYTAGLPADFRYAYF